MTGRICPFKEVKIKKYIKRGDPKTGSLYGYGVDDTTYKKEQREYFKGGGSKVIWFCPIFNGWKLMLRRVFQDKGYENCRIDKCWLLYSNYYDWYNKNKPKTDEKLVVEKDLISRGTSTYSPETCVIVPQWINTLISSDRCKNSCFPTGVYFDKSRGDYQGFVKLRGKREIKRFKNVRDAHRFWQLGKMRALQEALSEPLIKLLPPQVKIELSRLISEISLSYLSDKVTVSLKRSLTREYLGGEKNVHIKTL